MAGEKAIAEREAWAAASPPHAREPWIAGLKEILVHGRLAVMKGTEENTSISKVEMAKLYHAAKHENDMEAAYKILDVMWRPSVLDDLRSRVLASGVRPIIVSPHPSFDDDDVVDCDAPNRPGPKNALPFAHAARLRIALNGIANSSIVQGARVGRTKLPRFPRFLFQPHFVGDVATDRPYIIVDDNVGLGGTLAALYGHIRRNGGTVIGVAALAHSSGKNVPFALTEGTHLALQGRFGSEVCALWKEVVGHETYSLTEGECGFLLEWRSGFDDSEHTPGERLHALRDRLDKARAQFK